MQATTKRKMTIFPAGFSLVSLSGSGMSQLASEESGDVSKDIDDIFWSALVGLGLRGFRDVPQNILLGVAPVCNSENADGVLFAVESYLVHQLFQLHLAVGVGAVGKHHHGSDLVVTVGVAGLALQKVR